MALDVKSVTDVEIFFSNCWPDSIRSCIGRNQYGADEVYISVKRLSTDDLVNIASVSKKIGNTVSILPKNKDEIIICFW